MRDSEDILLPTESHNDRGVHFSLTSGGIEMKKIHFFPDFAQM